MQLRMDPVRPLYRHPAAATDDQRVVVYMNPAPCLTAMRPGVGSARGSMGTVEITAKEKSRT